MNDSALRSTEFLTRRRLIQHGAAGVFVGTAGHRLLRSGATVGVLGRLSTNSHPAILREPREAREALVDPTRVHSLAMRAIDTAQTAGATYADVRLTRTVGELIGVTWDNPALVVADTDWLELGVRALVNGYWGFAATPYWTLDEATRVATSAVAQAKTAAKGPSRYVELASMPVATGSWTTPIATDPFGLALEEKVQVLQATLGAVQRALPNRFRSGAVVESSLWAGSDLQAYDTRREQALATTNGSYVTQTVYQSKGKFSVHYTLPSGECFFVPVRGLTQAGQGWELWSKAKMAEQVPGLLAELEERTALPVKSVEMGRYAVVCDGETMTGVLDATLGRATQLDRALGYEANAEGTSYLGPDPLALLGTAVASPVVTVTADRSLPAGLATVQWDDEGVRPEDFPLVQAGTLVDYQTTREQAAWLAPWYARMGAPVRSHGCAAAVSAGECTTQLTPNLTLAPASGGADFETLVSGLTNGIIVERAETTVDFQCRTGSVMAGDYGHVYQVKNGKRVALLRNAGLLFNTSELWNNITTLGGTASVVHAVGSEIKGELSQRRSSNLETVHTVRAVPAVLKNQVVVDVTRKA